MSDNPFVNKDDQFKPATFVPPGAVEMPLTPGTPAGNDKVDLTISTIGASSAAANSNVYEAEKVYLTSPTQVNQEWSEADLNSLIVGQMVLQWQDQYYKSIDAVLNSWSAEIAQEKKLVQEYLNSPAYAEKLYELSIGHRFQQLAEHQADNPQLQPVVQSTQSVEVQKQVVSSPEYAAWVASLSPAARAPAVEFQQLVISNSDEIVVANLTARAFGVQNPNLISMQGIEGTETEGPELLELENTQGNTSGIYPLLFTVGMVSQRPPETGVVDKNLRNAARSNTETLLAIINDGSLDAFIATKVIPRMPDAQSLSDQRKDQLAAHIKIILASTALALAYKGETGWITDLEFGGMLLNKIPLASTDVKGQLAAYIMENIQKVPKNEAKHLMNALLSYVNTNPNAEDLTDTDLIFGNLLPFIIDQAHRGPARV